MACTYQIASIVNNPDGTRAGDLTPMQFSKVVEASHVLPAPGAVDFMPFLNHVLRGVHSGQMTIAQALLITETY